MHILCCTHCEQVLAELSKNLKTTVEISAFIRMEVGGSQKVEEVAEEQERQVA